MIRKTVTVTTKGNIDHAVRNTMSQWDCPPDEIQYAVYYSPKGTTHSAMLIWKTTEPNGVPSHLWAEPPQET